MTKTGMILSILITILIFYFGKQYSDTFFAGWIACVIVDFIDKLIKHLDGEST